MKAVAEETSERREPDRRRGHVDEPADGDAERRDEPGEPAAVDALGDDVEHRRAGHDDQRERRGREEREGRRRRQAT